MTNQMNDFDLQEKSIKTQNGKIFYYYKKPIGNNPTVVFLHGLTANHTQCSEIVQILMANGYGCLAPDLRGHGNSDKKKTKSLYKISVFVDDLHQIVNEEKLENITLAGYSFGGTIALDFSIKHPKYIYKLILISSSYTGPLDHWHINFLLPASKVFLGSLAGLLFWQKRKVYYYYRHNESLTYWRATLLGFLTMPISVDLWIMQEIISINLIDLLPKVEANTLIIQSTDDPFVSRKEISIMEKKIPNAEVVIATQDSHFIATRTQGETANFILKFIKQI